MSTTELDIRNDAEIERMIFDGPEQEVFDNPVEVQKQMLRRILTAETPDEIRRTFKAEAWQEYLDRPVEVRDLRLRKSDYEQGSQVFAIVDAIDLETGETVTLTTGGITVLATLVAHKRNGWLPWRWRLVKAERESAQGFRPLRLDDSGLDNAVTETPTDVPPE